MAEYAYNLYCQDAKFIDLQNIELPICDGDKCYENPIVDELKGYIENSSSIILASPIYNYDLNSVAKNLIELTGKSWTDKLVGFISDGTISGRIAKDVFVGMFNNGTDASIIIEQKGLKQNSNVKEIEKMIETSYSLVVQNLKKLDRLNLEIKYGKSQIYINK